MVVMFVVYTGLGDVGDPSMPQAHSPDEDAMLTKVHTGLDRCRAMWWKPAHKAEKVWVAIAFTWCMVLFAMMPLWHFRGGQNPSGVRRKVDPKAFYARTMAFATQYKVGEDRGVPIVQAPPGSDRLSRGAHLPVVSDSPAGAGQGVHAAHFLARREPRLLAVPRERQLPDHSQAMTTRCA
jgi:hypothetical protein